MPLNPAGLKTDLEALASSPKATVALCAADWASAISSYAAAVVPASTTVAAAAATLQTALISAFNSGAASAPMETAFLTFATTVGGGMAPAFVAVPPPSPVGFAGLFSTPYPSTHSAAATGVKNAIDAWAKTGTATPSGGGSPVNWS